MSVNKYKWLRNEDITHDINDLMEDFTTNRPMTVCIEDFAVKVWNKAIEEAKNTITEDTTSADELANDIAALEVDHG